MCVCAYFCTCGAVDISVLNITTYQSPVHEMSSGEAEQKV